jgi:rhodanese-related sulfurtransferase
LTPAEIRRRLIARQEIALLDLREEDVFGQAHPLFAASLPLSRLELEILDRVPRKATPIVLYDDGDGLTERGLSILEALGYAKVSLLEGGIEAWRTAGGELFRDVNVPSKAFGELVESEDHTPSLPADEVKHLIDSGHDMVILDARRFEEYRTMSIPRGVSVPGAELVLRAPSLAPDPKTTIIVNCAGRTRSLIGAQSLRNAGLPNPVYALRNGTIGWTLAGFALETGQERRFPEIDEAGLTEARAAARKVAYRAGVRHLAYDDLAFLREESDRTTYFLDVRTPEEFARGHLPGFRSSPGGQLVQETEVSAPVRGARIILFDDLGPRADMSASWLAQMGWDVLVLEDVPSAALSEQGPWQPSLPSLPEVETITAAGLAETEATLLDLGPGPAYRRGHIAGAHFVIRSRLAQDLPADLPREKPVVLISPDDRLARFAAPEVQALGFRPLVLEGGMAAWSPRPIETGESAAFSAFDDVYRRPYEGTENAHAAMQAYLDWEYGLVEQLKRDATHGFSVLSARPAR